MIVFLQGIALILVGFLLVRFPTQEHILARVGFILFYLFCVWSWIRGLWVKGEFPRFAYRYWARYVSGNIICKVFDEQHLTIETVRALAMWTTYYWLDPSRHKEAINHVMVDDPDNPGGRIIRCQSCFNFLRNVREAEGRTGVRRRVSLDQLMGS
ncbi:MAG TPA: hypothetical protein VJH71_03500 [Candidatus Paceibacterota bacterium]